jgi:predicted transcriptional regulator
MSKYSQIQKLEHSPRLSTILMVEKTLRNSSKSVLTIAELKRKLPKQINHNTLKIILEYLEESNKIAVSMKGITWIHNTNPNLRKAIKNGLEF